MPFTPSHTAAAIPFFRTRLIPSALMIGCMAPDFEYFLRFEPEGGLGHRISGVFLLDLPVSLIALWLFHAYAKEPIYSWLPKNFRQRIRLGPTSMPVQNFAGFLMVVLSILIGIATHILWDSFTHRNFWPYNHLLFLHRTAPVPLWGHLEYLRVLQHLSTAIGALALLLWVRAWYRRTKPLPNRDLRDQQRSIFPLICFLSVIAAMVRALLDHGFPDTRGGFKAFVGSAVVTGITVFWFQVVIYGYLRARNRHPIHNA